jgi:hypothetical protein
VHWRTRAEYAEGEIVAALGLPSTMAPAPGELARVLRQAEKDRDAALQGVCPQGFVVVTLAEREMFAENARRLERASAENGELRAVLRDSLEALFRYAPKCGECEERLATKGGYDDKKRRYIVCDRDECGHVIRCNECEFVDHHDRQDIGRCYHCGDERVDRIPLAASWRDLKHAVALRAANAAHDAEETR